MPTNPDLLKTALDLHRGGELERARELYEQIVSSDPRHAAAFNLLGLLARQQGQFDRAVDYSRQAVAIDGTQAAYLANLGESYRSLNQRAEAIECYRDATRIQPDVPEPHYHLGTLLADANRLDEAVGSFRRAVELRPQFAEAHLQLGKSLYVQGRLSEAAQSLQESLRWAPDQAVALVNLGSLLTKLDKLPEARDCYERLTQLHPTFADGHFHLGSILELQGHLSEAITCYRRAVECQPDSADALAKLGNALSEQGDLEQALIQLQRALRARPDVVAVLTNLGSLHQKLGSLDEAHANFHRAVELAPQMPELHFNEGTALRFLGQPEAAIACMDRALSLQPDFAAALWGRGMALLSMGRFAEGWAGFEHRVRCPQINMLRFPQPRWDGSALAGRTLLIHCEQGFGDTFQFIRYVKLAHGLGDKIIVAAQPALIPLLACSGITRLVSNQGELPPFDVHAPLLSLPFVFGTTIDTVPREVPYLSADPLRIEKWRQKLSRYHGLKIGIAWQGQTAYLGDRCRSIPLGEFAALSAVDGVQLFSLQKGFGSEQLPALARKLAIVDLASELDLEGGAFMDSAAVMQSLDLVVSCDTAIAHLAGALGARVWLPLSTAGDWRWMRDRDDSVWYPTMRLFRQRHYGDWREVFRRIAAEIRSLPPAS